MNRGGRCAGGADPAATGPVVGACTSSGVGEAQVGQAWRQVERAPERVDEAQAIEAQPPGAQQLGEPVRRDDGILVVRLGEGGIGVEPEVVVVDPGEAGDQQVGASGLDGQPSQVVGLGVGEDAPSGGVGDRLVVEQLVDAGGEGTGSRAVEQAAPEQGTGGHRRFVHRVQIDLAQAPVAGSIGRRQGHLPLGVDRHPGLAPVGDADRRRLDALLQRGVQQLADVGVPDLQVHGEHHLGAQAVADLGVRPPSRRGHQRHEVADGVGVGQRRLAHEVGALRWEGVMRRRRHDLAAGDEVGVGPHGLPGQPAAELLARVEATVVAVALGAVGAAHRQHRLGRLVPARVRTHDVAERRPAQGPPRGPTSPRPEPRHRPGRRERD